MESKVVRWRTDIEPAAFLDNHAANSTISVNPIDQDRTKEIFSPNEKRAKALRFQIETLA